MRTGKPEGSGNDFPGTKGLPADFALVLTVATIVVIDEMMRSPT